MKHTATMRELLERLDAAAKRCERMQLPEVRREAFNRAQSRGRVVLVDRVMATDPEGAFLAALVASDCGHLVRVALTAREVTVLINMARDEGFKESAR